MKSLTLCMAVVAVQLDVTPLDVVYTDISHL